MHWKTRIYEAAYQIADKFKNDPNVTGIAIGGSIAKGMVWKHSDLELCLIVDKTIEQYQYFNFMNGLGVEIIQVQWSKMEEFIQSPNEPDLGILHFPIQIYQCKIIYDPTNILARFKYIFDQYLFHPDIKSIREKEALVRSDRQLEKSRVLLLEGNYKTALAYMRIGINELLLAYYWHCGILPRSQNRTVYLLKKNTEIIGHNKLYEAFISIFCLNKSYHDMKESLAKAKNEIFKVSEAWGSNAPQFLEKAVDGNLEWGYPKSIIYVYKYCMHILLCKDINQEDLYDRGSFQSEYQQLSEFLDMNELEPERVRSMLQQFEEARSLI